MTQSTRPKGSNADEWLLFLEDHKDGLPFLAVQIAEAIEDGERYYMERALSRMGWPEIQAYENEWRNGQQDDDAGGYAVRAMARLFGIKRPLRCAWELARYKRSARAAMEQSAGVRA